MNCIKCYQEIPEGSKFCPYCGAEQTAMPDAGNVNEQPESTVQPEVNAQEAEPQQEEAVQTSTPVQQETNTQYQDSHTVMETAARMTITRTILIRTGIIRTCRPISRIRAIR